MDTKKSLPTYTKKRTRAATSSAAAATGTKAAASPARSTRSAKKPRGSGQKQQQLDNDSSERSSGSGNSKVKSVAVAVANGDNDPRKVALMELYRLLHVMEENPHGSTGSSSSNSNGSTSVVAAAAAESSSTSSSWQAILARADHGRSLYRQVIIKTNAGVSSEPSSILDPTAAKQLEERLEACCERAAEIALEKKNKTTVGGAAASAVDAVWNIFKKKPAVAAPVVASAASASAPDNEDDNDNDNDDDDDGNIAKPPPAAAAASANANAGSSVQDLQEEQREQMERAIGQMASQLRVETSKIHSKLKDQTGELDELEKAATENVEAVTDVAKDVEAHNTKTWRRNLGTWTLIFAMIGMFLFTLVTIQMAPKARVDWNRYHYDDKNGNKRRFSMSRTIVSLPGLVASASSEAFVSVSSTCSNAVSSLTTTDWKATSNEWMSSISSTDWKKKPKEWSESFSSIDWKEWIKGLKLPNLMGSSKDKADKDDAAFDLDALIAKERAEAAAAAETATQQQQQQKEECEMDMNGECIDTPTSSNSRRNKALDAAAKQEQDLHDKAADTQQQVGHDSDTVEETDDDEDEEEEEYDYEAVDDGEEEDDDYEYDDEGGEYEEEEDYDEDEEAGEYDEDDYEEDEDDSGADEEEEKPAAGSLQDELKIAKDPFGDREAIKADRVQQKEARRADPMDDAFSSDNAVRVDDAIERGMMDDVPIFNGRPFAPKDVRKAAAQGDAELLKGYLTARPQWSDKQDHNGWGPIHLAARLGHADAIQVLITTGQCQVGLETVDGRTALMIAAQSLGQDHHATRLLRAHSSNNQHDHDEL